MKLLRHGRNTLKVEVQGVSNHGIWLYALGEEYFLSYKNYPWFLHATIQQIYHVKLLLGRHLRWPALDIDLELDALRHPENYPLIDREKRQRGAVSGVCEKKNVGYGRKK